MCASAEGLAAPGGVLQEWSGFTGTHWVRPHLLQRKTKTFLSVFPFERGRRERKVAFGVHHPILF